MDEEGQAHSPETEVAFGGHVTTDSSDSSSSAEEDGGPPRVVNHDTLDDCVNWLRCKSRDS